MQREQIEGSIKGDGADPDTACTGFRRIRRPGYMIGKLEILKLRDDYRAKVEKAGGKFSLRDFHDRFIKAGSPPVKIVRRELLGADSGPVL